MPSPSRRASRSGRAPKQGVIRVCIGDDHATSKYIELELGGAQDARWLAQVVDDHLRAQTRQLLIISIDSHQPWLNEVLAAVIYDPADQLTDLNREVQYSSTSRLPENPMRGSWTYITDQINVPEVYHWSLGSPAPKPNDLEPLDLNKAKMRTGAWVGGPGSCRLDREVITVLIFTQNDPVSNRVMSQLLFSALYKDGPLDPPSSDTAICLIYAKLFSLLTDWQNIIRELNARLAEAEINSHHRDYPVKYRTRAMHREVARIHELKDYLRFHMRSFNKLQKIPRPPKRKGERDDQEETDDIVDDLAHFEENLDSLKERFNNLLGLEFNIQAADQSEGAAFLSVVATLFLPLSYLTSLWGISTSTWTTIWYVCAATIVFAASAAFLVIYPWLSKKWQKKHYHLDQSRVLMRPQDFTMLGDDLPDNVDIPSRPARGVSRHRSQQLGGMQLTSQRRRSSTRPEMREV